MPKRICTLIAASLCTTLGSPVLAVDTAGLPEAFDAGWKGEKTCELLYETDEVRVGRCTFPLGIGHEKHFHYPHFGYVLDGGVLSITDDQGQIQERQTITDTSWSTTEITVHSAINVGDTTTRYLIIEPKAASLESGNQRAD